MAVKKDKNCTHLMMATGEKGSMEVECFSLNKRGEAYKMRISTTIFRCSQCGLKQELPDTWEKNYRLTAKSRKAAKGEEPEKKKVESAKQRPARTKKKSA